MLYLIINNQMRLEEWGVSMRSLTCVFSGHRSLPSERLCEISLLLRQEIIKQIEGGTRYFGCGGALGFDTLAALTVLDLAAENPDIRLILVLPCEDQDKRWAASDKERYQLIKRRAHKIVTLHGGYVYGCMQERNRYLVDHAQCLISYLTQSRGGTRYTVNYAEKENIPVINIASLLK